MKADGHGAVVRAVARRSRRNPDPFRIACSPSSGAFRPGRVATYGDVAALAGRPRAARAVGNIMRGCARPDVPCHRVIAAGGRLGGYGGNEVLKRSLLVAEGVVVSGSRIRELDTRPLERSRAARGRGRRPTRGNTELRPLVLSYLLCDRRQATPADPFPV